MRFLDQHARVVGITGAVVFCVVFWSAAIASCAAIMRNPDAAAHWVVAVGAAAVIIIGCVEIAATLLELVITSRRP